MASAQVDLSEGCVGLTRDQFRRITKEQLISLAGVEDIELAKDIRKPVAYLTRELNLAELCGWNNKSKLHSRLRKRSG